MNNRKHPRSRAYSPLAAVLLFTTLAAACSAGAPDDHRSAAADPIETAATAGPLSRLSLPPGFRIELVTDATENARQLALSANDVLYVGTRRAGRVYAVTDWRDPARLAVHAVAEDLTMPSGLAWRDGTLYVGALDRVLAYDDIDARIANPPEPRVIADDLPDKRHHGWKYLSFGPDGMLYLPVGAPCNICLSEDARFASILRMDPATGATSVYAAGVRNSVGLSWHPDTDELWFTDNGRDMLGDDVPAEEVNRVAQVGAHYGYPHVHAGTVLDPEFGAGHRPADYATPEVTIQAHSAALGIDFYAGKRFPAHYNGALFIAEHGSWNRSKKVGYRVSVAVRTDAGLVVEPFVTGWLEGEDNWGRPNDVLVEPGGDLLIADDQFGAVYRVRYTGQNVSARSLRRRPGPGADS
ncbi:MAG: PQQ-dependent sugar dehydrogenase [Pseudomonadota bacterium]